MNKYLYNFLIFLIIAVSFYLYSPLTSYHYNSDQAIHILMSYHLDPPEDLYFWGQNRLGSLLPMIAYPFVKIGLSAPIVVSVLQWLMLSTAAFIFGSWIKNKYFRFLFYLNWFLPLTQFFFLTLLSHPYTVQFFLIATSIVAFEKIRKMENESGFKIFLGYFSFFTLLFLSLFVSEISVVFVFFLLLYLITRTLLVQKEKKYYRIIYDVYIAHAIPVLSAFFISAVAVSYLILAGKSAAPPVKEYDQFFGSSKEITDGFSILFKNIYSTLVFGVRNILVSFHNIFLIVCGIITLTFLFRRFREANIYTVVLLLSAFFSVILTTMSHWVYVNELHFRYYTFSYFLFIIALFVLMSDLQFSKTIRLSLLILTSLFTACSIGLTYQFRTVQFSNEHRFSDLKPFSEFKNSCFIGDFWTTYVLASVNPGEVFATPHDLAYVRSRHYAITSLEKDNYYIIKNGWLESFPDSIYQFGALFKKAGDPQMISRLEFCRYERIKYSNYFEADKLESDFPTGILGDTLPVILKADTTFQDNYLSNGPYRWLGSGKYIATYQLGYTGKSFSDSLILEITPDFNQSLGASKVLYPDDFESDKLIDVQIPFTLEKWCIWFNMKARITGNTKWFLKGISVIQL